MQEVTINTEFIKLNQLLKLANIVGQGSDVKSLLEEGLIKVNGLVATQRGKKIYVGDNVEVHKLGAVKVISEVY